MIEQGQRSRESIVRIVQMQKHIHECPVRGVVRGVHTTSTSRIRILLLFHERHNFHHAVGRPSGRIVRPPPRQEDGIQTTVGMYIVIIITMIPIPGRR